MTPRTDILAYNSGSTGNRTPSEMALSGTLSTEMYRQLIFFNEIILKPIICSSGFMLNVIGFYVLFHKSLRHSYYRYLMALLIADSGYLLCGFLRSTCEIITLQDAAYGHYLQYKIVPVEKYFLESAFAKTSGYLICLLSAERLLVILKPLQANQMFLIRHCGKTIITIFVITFVCHFPKYFLTEGLLEFDEETNISVFIERERTFANNSDLELTVNIYDNFIRIVFFFTPPIMLTISTIAILVSLRMIKRKRKYMFGKTGSSTMDQKRVTVALLVTSFSFLLTYMLLISSSVMNDGLYGTFGTGSREENIGNLLLSYCNVAWSINSANDFIIYLATNTKFRSAMKAMLCARCKSWTNDSLGNEQGKSTESNDTVNTKY